MPLTSYVSLRESISKQSNIVKSLASSLEKVNQASNLCELSNSSWPLLSSSTPPSLRGVHPASLLPSSSNSPMSSKILQHVSLAPKQLMIKYGPLGENKHPWDKSVKSQCVLRQLFNNWIDTNTPAEEGTVQPPPSHAIWSVSVFDRPAILLEFESDLSKDQFIKMCTSYPKLLVETNSKAHICPHTYTTIFCFVPCSGQFDPGNAEHLQKLECDNDLPSESISSASRCKHLEKRSSNQKTATLKVICVNSTSANLLITGCIWVADQLVNVHKDIHQPTDVLNARISIAKVYHGYTKGQDLSHHNHTLRHCTHAGFR